jgi:hypothetical protein
MQTIEDGYYWVMIKLFLNNAQIKFDWHLGCVKNGHFSWVIHHAEGSLGLSAIKLKELIDLKVPMVKIDKPKINQELNYEI